MLSADKQNSVVKDEQRLFPDFTVRGKVLDQNTACALLKNRIDALESLLSDGQEMVNFDQLHALLGTVSIFLESTSHRIEDEGYTRLLNRLIRIYTHGMIEPENPAFSATAAHYSKLVKIVSRVLPGYDYSRPIGQLLFYMNQLYRGRKPGWQLILQSLLSMPDNIEEIHRLKQKHLNQIQQWIEEGVSNLFQIRDEQLDLLSENTCHLRDMEERIERTDQQHRSYRGKVVTPIAVASEKKALQALVDEKESLILELEAQKSLINLLEENIEEFGDKLFATRRDRKSVV